jgi:hypothetical protein
MRTCLYDSNIGFSLVSCVCMCLHVFASTIPSIAVCGTRGAKERVGESEHSLEGRLASSTVRMFSLLGFLTLRVFGRSWIFMLCTVVAAVHLHPYR